MYKILSYCFVYFTLFLLMSTSCLAQVKAEPSTYTWFDEITGPLDLRLVNGIEYIEQHRMINDKTKFLPAREFLIGSVTYGGETYYKVPLKFNIYDDLLIVKLREDSNLVIYQLLNEKLTAFSIGDHQFVQINTDPTADNDLEGFYEILATKNQMKLLKRHRKNLDQVLEEDFVYYQFFDAEPEYYLALGKEYFPVNSRRDFLRLFKEDKREIRDFYRNYKSLRRSQSDQFMINLFNDIISNVATTYLKSAE